MTWLIWSDLSLQHRSSLTMIPLAALVMAVLAFVMGVAEAAAFPVVLVTMMAWGAALRAAYEDEKADAWTFARTLPITPGRVVAARYLAGLLVTLAFSLAVALPLALRGSWPLTIYLGMGAGLGLTGLFNALYYRFGYRIVSTWFRYLLLLIALGGMLLARFVLAGADLPAWLREAGRWMGAHPAAAPWLAAALVAALYLASWAYATAVFRRKELV